MKKRLLFVLLVTGLILLALGGWTVQGLRWAVGGGWLRATWLRATRLRATWLRSGLPRGAGLARPEPAQA